jgi:hypothetical protein
MTAVRLLALTSLVLCLGAKAPAGDQSATGADVQGWAEDLRLLASELERIHPRPWERVDRATFLSSVESVVAALPALTEDQRLVRLMQTVSLLRDGHTRVWRTQPGRRYAVFPVRVFQFEEGVFITVIAREYARLIGGQVIRFGSRPAREALEDAASLARGDNEFYGAAWAPESLVFAHLLRGLGIIGPADRLPLEVRLRDGSVERVELRAGEWDFRDSWFWWPSRGPAASDANEYVHAFENLPALPRFMNREQRRYWYEALPERGAMYLYFQSFADLPDEPFADFQNRMFGVMDERKLDRLIIDLRWNTGGNGALIWPLVYNIIKRERLHAPGRVFVITGRHSFSASVLAVAELRRHAHALVVGEPMAAPFNACGDSRTIALRRTGIRLDVSELYWQSGFPGDRRRAVAPDVIVPMTAADYFAGRDAAFERILDGTALGLEQTFARLGPEKGVALYRQVRAQYPGQKDWEPWSERELHDIGRNLRRAGHLQAAIAAYTLNTEAHPDSWNAWDDLGGACYKAGDLEQAQDAYKRSVTLNPGSANGVSMLQTLARALAARPR